MNFPSASRSDPELNTVEVPFGPKKVQDNASSKPTTASQSLPNLSNPQAVAVLAKGLITCAAAIYVYTNGLGPGPPTKIVTFHAHTGGIPPGYLPTDHQERDQSVRTADIYVLLPALKTLETILENPSNRPETDSSRW